MNNKYCPLISISTEDSLAHCQGELCAWYVAPRYPGMEGYCAIRVLGDLAPDLVQVVKTI